MFVVVSINVEPKKSVVSRLNVYVKKSLDACSS